MSALCQKRTFALQELLLFDHLVGTGGQRQRHRKPSALALHAAAIRFERRKDLLARCRCAGFTDHRHGARPPDMSLSPGK
jgi:hypothetical protein